ncbi:MAG: hypothetical protein ABIT16_13220 [Croceibacterium sp.]
MIDLPVPDAVSGWVEQIVARASVQAIAADHHSIAKMGAEAGRRYVLHARGSGRADPQANDDRAWN